MKDFTTHNTSPNTKYEAEEDENFYGDVEGDLDDNHDNCLLWEEEWCGNLNVFKSQVEARKKEEKFIAELSKHEFSDQQIRIIR